ncbi:MAG TPA: RNA polymerase sigma factor [Solirubrobacteraceae bacterium]|nr:RNA polymerase sigma factor [Solirubrobacteraceae bacterium]
MSPLPTLSDVLLCTQTDERLARLAGDGDRWAFAALVQRHRSSLIRLAARVVGPHRSEDVVQQGLLRAWVSLDAGTEVRNVQAWLYTIVRNAAYTEHARGAEGVSPIPDELTDHASSGAAEQRLEVLDLIESIAALPEHQRTALVETELEGRSRRQIAADMGVTEGAVRQLVHRARTSVRVAMTAITPYPLVAWVSRHSGGGRVGAGLSSLGDPDVAGRSAGLAEPAVTGAAAGSAALAVKGGVALLAAGAIGGLGWQSLTSPSGHHSRHAQPAPLAADQRGESARLGTVGPPASFDLGSMRPTTLSPAVGSGEITPASGQRSRAGSGPTSGNSGSNHSGAQPFTGSDHSGGGQRSGGGDGGGDRAGNSGSRSSGSDGQQSGGGGGGSTSQSSQSSDGGGGSDGGSQPPAAPVTASGATTSSDGGSHESSSAPSTPTTPRVGDN